MRKKLIAIGNSLGIVIERPVLDLLKIERDTELEVTTDGTRLIIAPVTSPRRGRVLEAAKRHTKAHAKVLKKLAE